MNTEAELHPGTASDLVAAGDPMQPALHRLLEQPGRFGFFQAMRVLYSAHGFDGRGSGARPGPVRFTTPASLSFPPSELHSVVQAETGTRVCVNFLGLTGPSGVLPRVYTEQLIARKQASRDTTAQDFLDLFNHRLVALFWLAWAKHRPEIGRQFGFQNSAYRYLDHLVGMGTPALQARMQPGKRTGTTGKPLPSAAMRYFSGLIAQRPHGERAIAQVVSAVVGAPVKTTGCLGTWQRIDTDARTCLGRGNHQLGAGCVLGTRYWDRQTTLRLSIGPIDRITFNALLPRGNRLGDVIELSRFLTGLSLDLRVQLSLRAEQVPRLRLGARDADRPQLGWNTWLGGRNTAQPANDCEFHFSAMGGQSWH